MEVGFQHLKEAMTAELVLSNPSFHAVQQIQSTLLLLTKMMNAANDEYLILIIPTCFFLCDPDSVDECCPLDEDALHQAKHKSTTHRNLSILRHFNTLFLSVPTQANTYIKHP